MQTHPDIECLYQDLAEIEADELYAIEAGQLHLLPAIRSNMEPIKRAINAAEGREIYSF